MPNLILGLFLLYLVLAGIKQFARLSPAMAARLVRQGGGVLGLLGALLLALRGSLGLASVVAGVAFSFAGWSNKPIKWTSPRRPGMATSANDGRRSS